MLKLISFAFHLLLFPGWVAGTILRRQQEQNSNGAGASILRVVTANPRIVGGTEVDRRDYEAFVQVYNNGGCGGSLIHNNIVLTAAHCSVRIGKTVYVKGTGSESVNVRGGIPRKVIESVVHPNYFDGNENGYGGLRDTIRYDFRILKLNRPVEGVAPVTLATTTSTPSTLTWIGFGKTCDSCELSPRLLEVENNGISYSRCRDFYQFLGYINETIHICGGGVPLQSSCGGDSGGPIFSAETGEQLGVVSFGTSCEDGSYTVGSRVSGALDWIDEQIYTLSTASTSSVTTSSSTADTCFSRYSTAVVEGKGKVPMEKIVVGDNVMTAGGQFEIVFLISHFDHMKPTIFLQICTTMQDENPLEIAPKHMMFVEGYSNPIPASKVQVGDLVRNINGHYYPVLEIRSITRNGFYNPLTASGTIVVDGITVSAYSAVFDTEHIEIRGFPIISQETFMHLAFAPFRTLCMAIAKGFCKDNDLEWYEKLGRNLLKAWNTRNAIIQTVLLASLVLFFNISGFALHPTVIIICMIILLVSCGFVRVSQPENKKKKEKILLILRRTKR